MPARRRSRCTAARRRSPTRGSSDWDLIARVASGLSIPVFGSGDCIEPSQMVERMQSGVAGVLVGRGALRNPLDLRAGRGAARPVDQPRAITQEERGQFLLDYIELLQNERLREADGLPPRRAGRAAGAVRPGARSRQVGDQQAARAQFLVHEGDRERLAPARHASTPPSRSRSCATIIEEFFFAPVSQ